MKLSANAYKVIVTAIAVPVFAAVLMTVPSAGASASVETTAELFKSKCATCHAADGSGNTPAGKAMKVRDLRSADVQGQTDEQLLEIVSKGKGKMPPYEKTLGADKCKQLVAHIRTLKQ